MTAPLVCRPVVRRAIPRRVSGSLFVEKSSFGSDETRSCDQRDTRDVSDVKITNKHRPVPCNHRGRNWNCFFFRNVRVHKPITFAALKNTRRRRYRMNMNRWKNIFLIIHRASWIHTPVRVVFASATIDTKIRLVKWLRVDNHITVRATGGMDQVVY